MTTSAGNAAAADKTGLKAGVEKATKVGNEKVVSHEKVMEKRRALGRGLDSLLPRPRAVAPTAVLPPASMARPSGGLPTQADLSAAAPSVAPVRTDAGSEPSNHEVHASGVSRAFVPTENIARRVETPVAPFSGVDLMASEGSDNPPVSSGERLTSGGNGESGQAASFVAPPAGAGVTSSAAGDEVVELALDLIDDNPYQTRRRFKEEPLKELAESIKAQGVLQPVVVRQGNEGRYRLILGERRLRASRIAGLEKIPAIVKRVSEQQAAEMTLVENLQRQDLNCIEQAEAFRQLSQTFMLTQDQIGERVGMSREAVANYMRLLNLPQNVHLALLQGELTFSHARVLLTLKTTDSAALWYYAKRAIDGNMSVAKFQNFVLGKYNPTDSGPPTAKHASGGPRWVDPNVKAAQRSLEEVLGMRVRIRDRAGRGRIVIDYATIDDFQRIVEMLGGR